MKGKEIINTNQFIWMLFIIITSFTVMQVPTLIIRMAGRDSWVSIVGGWVLDVLLAIVYAYMGIRFQGQNFVQYSITILGKYIGRIVGFLFVLFFLLVSVVLNRSLAQMLTTTFLPKTPMELILIIQFIIIGYTSRKGIEAMGRTSTILGPIYLISIIILGILLIPNSNLDYLKPQLQQGFSPLLIGSPFVTSFFGICVIMAMFIPICNKPKNGFIAKFAAVSMGALALGIVVMFGIMVYSVSLARNMNSLSLAIARTASLGNVIEHAEVIWVMTAIGAGIMASTYLIWASSVGLSQIVDSKDYKHWVLPLAAITMVLSWSTFNSNIEQQSFITNALPIIGIFVESGLELFLFFMALILKKRVSPAM